MKLKLCGMTRTEDARCAAQAGADYLGAILVPSSRRHVTLARAAELFAMCAPALPVLVTRDMPLAELQHAIDTLRPFAVQLHGDESPEYARGICGVRVWKAFDLRRLDDLEYALAFPCEMLVADSGGGTGIPCDWSRAARLAASRPVLLAGGISPEYAAAAIAAVHPAGLDAARGVESAPGVKDHEKIGELCALVKGVRN